MKKRVVQSLRSHLRALTHEDKAQLAADVSASPVYLYHIASGFRRASATLAIRLEKATFAKVTRTDVRPDIFGVL